MIVGIPPALLFGFERPGPGLKVGSLKKEQIEGFESTFELRRRSPITKVIPGRPWSPTGQRSGRVEKLAEAPSKAGRAYSSVG